MKKNHRIKPVESRTDFAATETQQLKNWYSSGLVEKYLHRNDTADKTFSFMDGPITANNPMGVHHGWGRTYKDLWQRYHNLKGYRQRFQSGFDAQGLWVEVEVEKELGFKSKKDIEKYGVAKFVQKCRDRVAKYSAIQTEQSKRLGYFMDWDHSYFTLSEANNYMIWHFIQMCHKNGWLYKGRESVPWCPRCQTAISQHEMLTEDYKEVTHKAIYFKLPLVRPANTNKKRSTATEYLLVWTTTPWTIPANIAVAVDKDINYALVKGETGDLFWVARDAVDRIFADTKHAVINTVAGSKLVGQKYTGPFDELPAVKKVAHQHPDTFHTVVATDKRILPIETSEGTGLVHTAVSAGTEDFKLGKKLGLPMIPVIADDASYLEDLGFLTGKNAKQQPELILDYLANQKTWVFKIHNYKHRYPGCWRCKTELVWKVTDEWYIAMDKSSTQSTDKRTLRQRMKAVAKKIRWIPEFGLKRELDWLNNMHDWLISKKNRYWGLCLPIWECAHCQHFEVVGSHDELKKRAVKGWELFAGKPPHKPYIDKVKIKCSQCGHLATRIEPVGNPWLDAGIVPFSTITKHNQGAPLYLSDKKAWQDWFPANFITESFPGQFKNWFYSMIAMSTVLEDTNPFQTVLGYATALGEDGRAMHKSWGNAIEFNEAAEKIGADVMRWLYCRQNPSANLLFGYTSAAEVKRQFHLILWNSYRFFANYAALEKWQPKQLDRKHVTVLDKWIVSRLDYTVQDVTQNLDKFDAFHATQCLEAFVQDLSTWYIRRSRGRIGPAAPDGFDKQVCYATLSTCFNTLSRLLAPFMPFMSDEIYTNLTGEESVHLADWPKVDTNLRDPQLESNMSKAREVVEKAHAQRKSTGINLRQPLAGLDVSGPAFGKPDLHQIILDEVNAKHLTFSQKQADLTVTMDTTLTPELIAEGKARDLIRQIQKARQQAGVDLDQPVIVTLPDWPKQYEAVIKQKVLAAQLVKGSAISIKPV